MYFFLIFPFFFPNQIFEQTHLFFQRFWKPSLVVVQLFFFHLGLLGEIFQMLWGATPMCSFCRGKVCVLRLLVRKAPDLAADVKGICHERELLFEELTRRKGKGEVGRIPQRKKPLGCGFAPKHHFTGASC